MRYERCSLFARFTRVDAGTKLGYVKAVLHFALKRPELGPELKVFIKQLLG